MMLALQHSLTMFMFVTERALGYRILAMNAVDESNSFVSAIGVTAY